jgi:hypothetical protein
MSSISASRAPAVAEGLEDGDHVARGDAQAVERLGDVPGGGALHGHEVGLFFLHVELGRLGDDGLRVGEGKRLRHLGGDGDLDGEGAVGDLAGLDDDVATDDDGAGALVDDDPW